MYTYKWISRSNHCRSAMTSLFFFIIIVIFNNYYVWVALVSCHGKLISQSTEKSPIYFDNQIDLKLKRFTLLVSASGWIYWLSLVIMNHCKQILRILACWLEKAAISYFHNFWTFYSRQWSFWLIDREDNSWTQLWFGCQHLSVRLGEKVWFSKDKDINCFILLIPEVDTNSAVFKLIYKNT